MKGTGKRSHTQTSQKSGKRFTTYRAREMKLLESDFDRAVKALGDASKERDKR